MPAPDLPFRSSDPDFGPSKSTGAAHACFRTLPDGRIPLAGGVLSVLNAGREIIGNGALVTRHTRARMIVMGRVPALTWCPFRQAGVSDDGALLVRPEPGQTAWGRLGHCTCCGSPGRVELLDATGVEFLQFSAPPDCEPAAWSQFLAATRAPFPSPMVGQGTKSSPRCEVCLPLTAYPLQAAVESLEPLMSALGEEASPVCCTLATPETLHRRCFIPRWVHLDGGVLSAGDGRTTVQLALPTAHALAITVRDSSWSLHVAGPGDALLLTLESAPGSDANATWRAALHAILPELT